MNANGTHFRTIWLQPGDDRVAANGLCAGRGGRGGRHVEVLVAPPGSPAANYGFDVTPARLVTERGRCRGA